MSPKANRGPLDYPLLGLTRLAAQKAAETIDWPKGFDHVDRTLAVGAGQEAFDALAEGIMSWEIQRRAGLQVKAPTRAAVGAHIVSGFGVGNLRLPVPCEVVWALEPALLPGPNGQELQMAGFGYGTLPGHPALGEEAFIAMMKPDGGVYFRLLAFSKPAGMIYALGAPVNQAHPSRRDPLLSASCTHAYGRVLVTFFETRIMPQFLHADVSYSGTAGGPSDEPTGDPTMVLPPKVLLKKKNPGRHREEPAGVSLYVCPNCRRASGCS